jgi:hypothetical protein
LLKHPILDDGILLNNTRRVEAFGYITILALIVASYFQYIMLIINAVDEQKTIYLGNNLTPEQEDILALAELSKDIYVTPIWEM